MEDKKYNRLESIKYMIDNEVYGDEWSGAGMYEAIVKIIKSDKEDFMESFLIELLDKASKF